MKELSVNELAKYFDHTLLKADANEAGFKKLCDEAKEYGFKMVAINSYPVKMCSEFLKDSDVFIGAAIAFPLGQMTIKSKVAEVENAIKDGCDEIDYVINISKLKENDLDYIEDEMKQIVEVCKKNNVTSKVIFENCYLTKEEIKKVSNIAAKVKPNFIKTSTGFGTGGATLDDIMIMKDAVEGSGVLIKAAGGIRTLEDALSFIHAGVKRLGSSASVSIVNEYKKIKE